MSHRTDATVQEWAQKMAHLCEPGHEAGWGIYADWLHSFLSAVRIAEAGVMPWTERNVAAWCEAKGWKLSQSGGTA